MNKAKMVEKPMGVIYAGGTKFTKFWLKSLLSNKLEECTEEEFDSVITKHRELYEMKYEGVNRQLFELDGAIEGARER